MFTLQDGSVISLKHVVIIGASFNGQYNIIFNGGHHETLKETFKSRASFITDWSTANGL